MQCQHYSYVGSKSNFHQTFTQGATRIIIIVLKRSSYAAQFATYASSWLTMRIVNNTIMFGTNEIVIKPLANAQHK